MIVAGVWTGFGFSNLKNRRIRSQIPNFCNRSGVGAWKSYSGHLWSMLNSSKKFCWCLMRCENGLVQLALN